MATYIANQEEWIQAAFPLATPLQDVKDLSGIIERIKDARVVMLGEASHGTHEYYEWRRLISEWLVVKHGFRFIAIEGDWPPSQIVNRYVLTGEGRSAREAVEAFDRWPTWMWANTEVIRLIEWLRSHNATHGPGGRVGFYGLDIYSLFESIDAVLTQLEKINPFLARRARKLYSCFEPFHGDERAYARSLMALPEGCEAQVVQSLVDLLKQRVEEDVQLGISPLFDAQQNARVVRNAEQYLRAMIHADEASWNIRDRHMMETLNMLLQQHGPEAKAIVWAHNSHVGDYRATDMAKQGLVNLGGLARASLGSHAVALVGFGSYEGSVIASHSWDGPIEKRPVPPAKFGTIEAGLHALAQVRGAGNLSLIFDQASKEGPLAETRGHRSIGVVYEPEHERWSNFTPTSLSNRYDGFIYLDKTTALEPLIQDYHEETIPETWPRGV